MGFWDGSGISWTICKQSAPRSRQTTTQTPHRSIFTGQVLFLTPNQQHQSTEGTSINQSRHKYRHGWWSRLLVPAVVAPAAEDVSRLHVAMYDAMQREIRQTFHCNTHTQQDCIITCSVLFCSLAVLDPRVGHTVHVLSPFILVLRHSDWLYSTESPVHVLMLSIQVVRGLPRLRAPGIVPCVISFSRQLPCFLMVWP